MKGRYKVRFGQVVMERDTLIRIWSYENPQVAPTPSTWTGLGPDVKVLCLDLLLMGNMRHTQEATVFRTLMHRHLSEPEKGFLAVVVGMSPWNAGQESQSRRASWRRRRRGRRRLRFGQQGQLAARRRQNVGWGAHCRKILGLVPAGGAGGGTSYSCCEGARMRSLGNRTRITTVMPSTTLCVPAFSSARAFFLPRGNPSSYYLLPPSPSSHKTTSWGEWALPAASSPPQPITIRSPPPSPDRQTWHPPLGVSWLAPSTVPPASSPSPEQDNSDTA